MADLDGVITMLEFDLQTLDKVQELNIYAHLTQRQVLPGRLIFIGPAILPTGVALILDISRTRRGQPYGAVEVSTRLRVPIGHLEQELVTARCAVPFPPSTVRRSASYAC